MTMNAVLKTQLQARISAVDAATPIEDLLRLAAIARSEPFDSTALDLQITERSAAVTAGTALAALFALAAAAGEPRDVPVGGIIRASASLPPVYEDRYIAAGNFVTAGFSPKLQELYDNFFGYKSSDGSFNGSNNDYIRGFDTDGAGVIIIPSGGGELMRSADFGATWTDIKSLVGWTATTIGAVKHISGIGAAGKWLVQHNNGSGFISNDGGATWSSIATLSGQPSAVGFIANSTSGQYVIAKGPASASILRSTNYGDSFAQIVLSGTSATVTCCTHIGGGIFVAAGAYQLTGKPCYWISTDYGATWSDPVQIDTPSMAVYSICYAPKYDRVYFAGANQKLAAIKGVSTGEPVVISAVPNFYVLNTGSGVFLGLAATTDGFLFAKYSANNGFFHKEVADESLLIAKAPVMSNAIPAYGGIISKGDKLYTRSFSVGRFDEFQHAVGLYPNTTAGAVSNNEIQYMRYR